jgi:MFS family permease
MTPIILTPARSASKPLPRTVKVLGGVSFLNDAASDMIYPLLPLFLTQTLGAGPAALGLIEGVAESTASLFKLFSGVLSDRVRNRKVWILGGYGASNLVRPLMAFVTVWPQILILRFVDRVGKGVRTSPRDALVTDAISADQRGRAFGYHRAMDHAGAVVGPLVAALFLVLWDQPLRTLFLFPPFPAPSAFCSCFSDLRGPNLCPNPEPPFR